MMRLWRQCIKVIDDTCHWLNCYILVVKFKFQLNGCVKLPMLKPFIKLWSNELHICKASNSLIVTSSLIEHVNYWWVVIELSMHLCDVVTVFNSDLNLRQIQIQIQSYEFSAAHRQVLYCCDLLASRPLLSLRAIKYDTGNKMYILTI